MKPNIAGMKCSKIWVYFVKLSSFPEILVNTFPFDSGDSEKRKPV